MFHLIAEPLPGLKIIEPRLFADTRGSFVKTFHESLYRDLGIEFELREEFFSVSRKDVLRGMHFQTPPHAHDKLVYCSHGAVLDVVVDLRRHSPTYGQYTSVELSAENRLLFFIPTGFAHGFVSLRDDSCMIYKTNAVYAPENDTGIRWDSFGFAWPVSEVVVSERDRGLPALGDSPAFF